MIFYAPAISESPFLSEEESSHAVRVLRLDVGDRIELVDGIGNFYEAEIVFPHHKKCEVRILNKYENFNTFPYHLHIAIAPTKNMDRLEWFVEKATEIGISEITPLLCRYSERKVVKLERINKIIVSAMKQSKKSLLPQLNEMISFNDFIKKCEGHDNCFIAHCYNQNKQSLSQLYLKGNDATIVIGPEGDFSEEEVESALKNGFSPITLGESRLRTETAGIVACHTIQLLNSL
ncbi:MAG: 16S rRNA (uracil(1498)-N(3))-methyltransferase [Paludibacteraceae bacterium]|jgi:16S rRNA (uracil1498-N3)-methyltransferase|nr:16S rRNA (uracil(1498)-N(3))-methyltransferase [Paludibacteraceae bacterium]